jgi:hypothetical protein
MIQTMPIYYNGKNSMGITNINHITLACVDRASNPLIKVGMDEFKSHPVTVMEVRL